MYKFDTSINIYPYFVKYLTDLRMTKIDNNTYAAQIHCALGNIKRYIFAMVRTNSEKIGTITNLSKLIWVSLQFRSLENSTLNLPIQSYIPRRIPELSHVIIRRTGSSDYIYDCPNIPEIIITLLPPKGTESYVDKNIVLNAIEQYNTIISFK